MATQRIRFVSGVSTYANGLQQMSAQGTNGSSPNGNYPQTGNPAPYNAGFTQPASTRSPYSAGEVSGISHTGGDEIILRVDRPAGTHTVKLTTELFIGAYCTADLQILDSDGATILFEQPGNSFNTEGASAPAKVTTAGTSLVALGAANTGVSIVQTGACFFVKLPAGGTFFSRLSEVEFDDGAGSGSAPTITSIDPTSGAIGDEVEINGTNLTGATSARHGPDVLMTDLFVDSDIQARAKIASGSPASGTIRITTPGGTAIGPTFTITPIFTSLQITNPNSSYTIGVLLQPVTARALDQFGATFLGALPACSVEALTLPVGVVGTLFEPFINGVATFDDLTATAGADVRGILAQPRAANWMRVRVRDALGAWRDVRTVAGADYQVSAVVTRDQEAPASFAVVTLRSGAGASTIKPAITGAPNNQPGRLLDVGRQFQVYTTVTDVGGAPADADFSLVFEGRIDAIDDTSVDVIRISGRDGMTAILDGVFGATQSYGSAAGVAVQTVLQQMLDYVLGAGVLTLSTPISPAWLIVNTPKPYEVKIGTSLYQAIKQLTDQIGWRLAVNYPNNVPTLQLLGPNRAPSAADWTIASGEIRAAQEVSLSLEPIRNRVTVQYRDASGAVQAPAISESPASIAAYGLRPLVVIESASSQIVTLAQAQRMADAIRVDLSLPLLTYVLNHQHAFWQILPGHVVDVLANSVHFDTTQRLAVARTVLTLENGGGSVAISLRGAPASRGRSWLELGGPTPDVDVTSTDTFASATFSAGGTLRINVIGPIQATQVRAAVSTSSPPSALDVDNATGTLSAGSSMASLTTPGAYAVGTTVYVAARAYIGGVGTRVIQLVVNRDAEAGDVALGPSLTVRTEFSDALCTISYVGTGTITISDDGDPDFIAAPASPFTRGRAAAGSNTVHSVTVRAALNGQTITNEVTIPPRSTVDTDTVTPDLDVQQVSDPTAGGTAALHVEYVVTGSNPKPLGPVPTLTVDYDSNYLTVQYYTGSAWNALPTGSTLTSGTRVRALRPVFGNPTQSITFTAALTGGGKERIVRSVPNQDPPRTPVIKIVVVPAGTNNTQKTYRVTTDLGNAQVRWIGGTAGLLSGPPINQYNAEPQDYTFARPALGGSDASAGFEALANGRTDADFQTISSIDRDTVGISARIVTLQGSETATQLVARVSGSAPLNGAPYYDGISELTDAAGLTIVRLGDGVTVGNDAQEYLAIGGTPGSFPNSNYWNDYRITKPPIGSLPRRVLFTVLASGANIAADVDAIDVYPIIALVQGRLNNVSVFYFGATAQVRFVFFDAGGIRRNVTAGSEIDVIWTSVAPDGTRTETPVVVTYDGGVDNLLSAFDRPNGHAITARIRVAENASWGTARLEQDVTVQTYSAPGAGSMAPRLTNVGTANTATLDADPGDGNLEIFYDAENLPSGGSVWAVFRQGAFDVEELNVTAFPPLRAGIAKRSSNIGRRRLDGALQMRDASSNVVASVAFLSVYYWP